jgi:SWI/SNF-related matrix-associated actin-dependent regulator of chromatin subfamily A-like protein 1
MPGANPLGFSQPTLGADNQKAIPKDESGGSLFPFQQIGIAFALNREAALIADSPGLGKTAQAIGVINGDLTLRKILIVCPASMRIPWQRELEKWLTRPLSVGVIGVNGEDQDLLLTESDVAIVNYDRVHRFTKEIAVITYDLCILDECHYAKNLEAKRTRVILQITARRRLALSGTPMLNRPIELYPVLSWLDPEHWPARDLFKFGRRYCGAHHNGFGWDLSGASNLEELSVRLRSTVMIRRTKAEVLPELPPKIRTVIELIPTAGMREALCRERSAYELPHLRVDHAAIDWDNLAVVRHQTAIAKLPLVIDYVREMLASDTQKVVVFAHHRNVIEHLYERLRQYHPVILIGGMGPKERQASIDAFHGDAQVRVFLGNLQAAGTGITLAPASSHCVFAEMSWVPAEMTQAEDRLHRIGTRNCVTVHHLVLEGSLDAMMVRVLLKKQRILDAVLEERTVVKVEQ